MKPHFCWEEGGEKERTKLEIRLSEANGCVCLLGSNNSNLPLNAIIHHNASHLPHEPLLLISALLFRDLKAFHKH